MSKDNKKIRLEKVQTEKSFSKADSLGQYTFYVPLNSNKIEIAKTVEEEYDVEVDKVRTLILPAKFRRDFSAGTYSLGSDIKKAIVTLKKGKIKNFSEFD